VATALLNAIAVVAVCGTTNSAAINARVTGRKLQSRNHSTSNPLFYSTRNTLFHWLRRISISDLSRPIVDSAKAKMAKAKTPSDLYPRNNVRYILSRLSSIVTTNVVASRFYLPGEIRRELLGRGALPI
jgi:hypothetical protein